MTKTRIDIPEDVKEVNMCKAIEDLINDSKAEGEAKGRLEGDAKGRFDTLISLVNDNILSIKDAADRVNMTEEAFTVSALLRHLAYPRLPFEHTFHNLFLATYYS